MTGRSANSWLAKLPQSPLVGRICSVLVDEDLRGLRELSTLMAVVFETMECRDMASISNRMNQVMEVPMVIASSIACLVVMGLISLTKVLWFQRQGWFQDWTGMR